MSSLATRRKLAVLSVRSPTQLRLLAWPPAPPVTSSPPPPLAPPPSSALGIGAVALVFGIAGLGVIGVALSRLTRRGGGYAVAGAQCGR